MISGEELTKVPLSKDLTVRGLEAALASAARRAPAFPAKATSERTESG